jgi:IPT/TIG domain
MSLGVVLAARPSPTAKPSPSSGLGLGTTDIDILIGVVAALLLVSLAVAWFASQNWRRRRSLRRQSPQGPAVSLAVRSAFARGDYMAVIDMAKGELTAGIKLLVAQSYARIGADGQAANTASEAINDILNAKNWSDAEPAKGISVLETRALRSWLDRLDGVDQSFDPAHLAVLRAAVLGPTLATPEEPVQLSSELDEIRQRVAAEHTAEETASSRYRWVNLGTGTLAGGLAAASGVVGVAKGSLAVIAILAFLSAAFTAILTTLKPAERENESKLRADALGQLAAAIDLFDIDRPHDARGLLLAVKEVHERLAIAEGHAKIVPLGASSKSTVGTAITSISQTEGPTAGGQNLTITGTGFTGATRVRFGANNASSYQVVSDTEITATTPAHAAGSVKVTVAGPGGTSPDNALARYTYIAAPQNRLRKRRAGPQAQSLGE